MEPATVIDAFWAFQNAFSLISTLNLTASSLPPPAKHPDGSCYDYVVVGGGSAGCVVASRLSELRGASVLLIEAGPVAPLEASFPSLYNFLAKSRVDWNYTTVEDGYAAQGQRDKVIALTRGKMLGGSSAANAMFYVRGAPRDFDSWAETIGDPRWNYTNVLQFFIKSERLQDRAVQNSRYGKYHGTKGYLGVTREQHPENKKYLNMYRELGNRLLLDINGEDCVGYTEPMQTIAEGRRQDTAYAFLAPASRRHNLRLLTDTLVTEILFDGNRAVGVRALTKDKKLITVKARREVIVSAGAFNSAQLLMLSGIGPRAHLQQMDIPVRVDLPVGENLQDHLVIPLFFSLAKGCGTPPPQDAGKFPMSVVMGLVALNTSQPYADYQTGSSASTNAKVILQACLIYFQFNDTICKSLYESATGKVYVSVWLSNLQPLSRGRVLLRSKNATDAPLIFSGYYSNDIDLQNSGKYLRDYSRIMQSSYFRRAGGKLLLPRLARCNNLPALSEAYWRCYALAMSSSTYHYSGTCALGGVLDSELRVRGTAALRVADAGVMPTITRGNTNAPTIMIAEKAAHFIKQQYKSTQKKH